MKCTKKLALSAYLVKYYDLREPKTEIYIVDEDGKKVMELLGVELTGFIKAAGWLLLPLRGEGRQPLRLCGSGTGLGDCGGDLP